MIKYSHFEKIILDFQLKSHHHFLSKFISIFRVYDPNNFGYINEEQFRDMMGTIDPDRKVDIQKLLHLIDPHEMNVVPFSACVSVFSAEPISEDEEGVTTILQYISNEHV
jgi:Ca2+-binding EF-hand superfamily protein